MNDTKQEEKEEEVADLTNELDWPVCDSATGVRTFLIFKDLAVHFEFRVGYFPRLPDGTIIHFELSLRNPRKPKQIRKIDGPYMITGSKLIYSNKQASRHGLSQYIELVPSKS
jgi:hypothetical protein